MGIIREEAGSDPQVRLDLDTLSPFVSSSGALVAPLLPGPSRPPELPRFPPERNAPDDPPLHLVEDELRLAIATGALRRVDLSDRPIVGAFGPMRGVWRGCRRRARLIHDMRQGNVAFPTPPHFILTNPRRATAPKACVTPRFACSIDISNAYWHLVVDPSIRDFFRAAAPQLDGPPSTYVWDRVPFGWSWAPFLFQAVMAPLISTLRQWGVWVEVYLDDLLILGSSSKAAADGTTVTLALLERLGWTVNYRKSTLVPMSIIQWLGVGIDMSSDRVCLFWPQPKALTVCLRTHAILVSRRCSVRDLQRVVGRVGFLRTICNLVGALTRSIDGFIAEFEHDPWFLRQLPPSIVAELDFILHASSRMADRRFLAHAASHLLTSVQVRVDASDTGFGVTLVLPEAPPEPLSPALLPPSVVGLSSTHREQYGAVCAALAGAARVPRGSLARVTVYSDNTGCVALFVRGRIPAHGASAPAIHLLEAVVTRSSELIFTAVQLPRALLDPEDFASRLAAGDASHARLADLPGLMASLGRPPRRRDLFACAANALLPLFFSPLPEPLALGMDAFAHPWVDGDWAYPPFGLADVVTRHLTAAARAAGRPLDIVSLLPLETILPACPYGLSWRSMELPVRILLPPSFADSRVLRLRAAWLTAM